MGILVLTPYDFEYYHSYDSAEHYHVNRSQCISI